MSAEQMPILPWQLWALLAAFFAALTAVFSKVGVSEINPDFATLIRTAVVFVSLAALLAATGEWRSPGPLPLHSWVFLILSGLATGASWLCYFRAMKFGPASQVAPLDKLSVVMVALFAFLWLGERPSLNGWLGIALMTAGAALIALKS